MADSCWEVSDFENIVLIVTGGDVEWIQIDSLIIKLVKLLNNFSNTNSVVEFNYRIINSAVFNSGLYSNNGVRKNTMKLNFSCDWNQL